VHQPVVRGMRQMADLDEDPMNGLTSNGLRGRPSSMLQVLRAHLLLLLLVIPSTSLLFQACHPHLHIALWHIIMLVWKRNHVLFVLLPLLVDKGENLCCLYIFGEGYIYLTLRHVYSLYSSPLYQVFQEFLPILVPDLVLLFALK